MNETKHTPEPWRAYTTEGGRSYIDSGDNRTCVSMLETSGMEGKHNAARIVACVNACAGLDPAAIGELVEAAIYVAEWSEEMVRTSLGSGVAKAHLRGDKQRGLHALRAALAKLRGERG